MYRFNGEALADFVACATPVALRAGCACTSEARSCRSIMAAAPGVQAGHQHRVAHRLRQNFTAA